jgi:hypothetical protein
MSESEMVNFYIDFLSGVLVSLLSTENWSTVVLDKPLLSLWLGEGGVRGVIIPLMR